MEFRESKFTRLPRVHSFLFFVVDLSTNDFDAEKMQNSNVPNDIIKHFKYMSGTADDARLVQKSPCYKSVVICSCSSAQQFIPSIHSIRNLEYIYIICQHEDSHEWINQWNKCRGSFVNIQTVVDRCTKDIAQINHDDILMNVIDPANNIAEIDLNRLDPGFMYTMLLKNTFLKMDFEYRHDIDRLTKNITEKYVHKLVSSKSLEDFRQNYDPSLAVNWYTQDKFVYVLVNEALRSLEFDLITDFGFFIKDLHRQLEVLYAEHSNSNDNDRITLYRGQGLSKKDFERMTKTKGALLAFNCFLSTTPDEMLALEFAAGGATRPNHIGVRFKIVIDPMHSSVPFADIQRCSVNSTEEEYLFAMNTVFRIGEIDSIDPYENMYEVNLSLVIDDDPQLKLLTDYIESRMICSGSYRIACILYLVNELEKSESILRDLSENKPNTDLESGINTRLGHIKLQQAKYREAIEYYRKSLTYHQAVSGEDSLEVAMCYGNIGVVYKKIGEYIDALDYIEKAFAIRKKIFEDNHETLGFSYHELGGVYFQMGDYQKALDNYQKALDIQQGNLPNIHPDLIGCQNNVALTYVRLAEYKKAQSIYEDILSKFEHALPEGHPDIAEPYNGLGIVFDSVGDFTEALAHYKKSHSIFSEAFPPNHPSVIGSYKNMGSIYDHMGEYDKAVPLYEEVLNIEIETLPPNHPEIARTHHSLAGAYFRIRENQKALDHFEIAIHIARTTLSENHPTIADIYHNTGLLYASMGKFEEALSKYQSAIAILTVTFKHDHPNIAHCYHSIGSLYMQRKQYVEALSYHQIALSIAENVLPHDHPGLAGCYNNLGLTYFFMGDYPEALKNHKLALAIRTHKFSGKHPDVVASHTNIGLVYQRMGDYEMANSHYLQVLDIQQRTLPENHPSLVRTYSGLGMLYIKLKNRQAALESLIKARSIAMTSFPAGNPLISLVSNLIMMLQSGIDLNLLNQFLPNNIQ